MSQRPDSKTKPQKSRITPDTLGHIPIAPFYFNNSQPENVRNTALSLVNTIALGPHQRTAGDVSIKECQAATNHLIAALGKLAVGQSVDITVWDQPQRTAYALRFTAANKNVPQYANSIEDQVLISLPQGAVFNPTHIQIHDPELATLARSETMGLGPSSYVKGQSTSKNYLEFKIGHY